MPLLKQSEAQLGLTPLMEIKPEWWQNISQLIMNAMAVILENIVDHRYMIEEVKVYTIEKTRVLWKQVIDQMVRFADFTDRIEKRIDGIEKRYDFKIKDCFTKIATLDTSVIENFKELSDKVDVIPDADKIYDFCVRRNEETKEILLRKLVLDQSKYDLRFDMIEDEHLFKKGLIGPTEDCPYKSVVNYIEIKMIQTGNKMQEFNHEISEF
jgi:hypothetical protein